MTKRKKGDIVIWRGQRIELLQEKMRGWIAKDVNATKPGKTFFADAGEMRTPVMTEAQTDAVVALTGKDDE